ncbi:MAG: hypothetical protein KGL40_04555 [Rhodocyclaceae bacterium]|nr:hypothetical protein [Rhodocyclaceae bacterium]
MKITEATAALNEGDRLILQSEISGGDTIAARRAGGSKQQIGIGRVAMVPVRKV